MKLTVEISLYPFREDFRDPIRGFIAKLQSYEGLRVTPGPTATVVIGEYDRVMAVLGEMFRWSHAEYGQSVFVTKFLPGYDPSHIEGDEWQSET